MRYEGTKIYMRKSTPLGLDILRKTTDLREPPPGIWFIGEVYWVYWLSESWTLYSFKRIQKNMIEKVVISVLIFYRLLQGPDFRTFDLEL